MKENIIFCFSGQGSQYFRMGREFFNHSPVFRSWMKKLDDIVKQKTGRSVLAYMFNTEVKLSTPFDLIDYSHPAIFMQGFALSQYCLEQGIKPRGVCGASLGEYIAAAVAGVITYEEALTLVLEQARIVAAKCPPGGMMALLKEPDYFYFLEERFPGIVLSSINSNTHFVLSGTRAQLEAIDKYLKDQDLVYQELPVCYGFHSHLIDDAAEEYTGLLKSVSCQPPGIEYFSCVTGDSLEEAGAFEGDYLWRVCRSPIRIREVSLKMEANSPRVYLDLGPSGTMANLIKQNIKPGSSSVTINSFSPFGKDSVNIARMEKALNDITRVSH